MGTIANCWFWRRLHSQIDAEVKLGCLMSMLPLQLGTPLLPEGSSPTRSSSVTTVLNRFFQPGWVQRLSYFQKTISQTYISKKRLWAPQRWVSGFIAYQICKKTWLILGLQLSLLPTMSIIEGLFLRFQTHPNCSWSDGEPDYIILFFYFHFIIYYHYHLLS